MQDIQVYFDTYFVKEAAQQQSFCGFTANPSAKWSWEQPASMASCSPLWLAGQFCRSLLAQSAFAGWHARVYSANLSHNENQ